jgi:phage shock protein A
MKKAVTIGMVVAGIIAATGFSIAEVREYLQVAGNRASESLRDAIPLSVEIDRMQVLIGKLDNQVASQKYAVARSQIALQDSEAEHARSQSRCQNLLAEMQHLRGLNTTDQGSSGGCQTASYRNVSTSDVQRALSYKLAAYREAEATCKAHNSAMSQQRQAYSQFEQQFTTWQSQRRLLSQRLETLTARYQTQQLASETNTTVFNNADLARATELADQIERELRIVEAQHALGGDPANSLLTGELEPQVDIEAEVDRLLSSQI